MFSCFEEDSDDEVHYYREAEDDFKDLKLDQELQRSHLNLKSNEEKEFMD